MIKRKGYYFRYNNIIRIDNLNTNEKSICNNVNQMIHSNDLIKFVQGGNNLLFPSNVLCMMKRLTTQFNFINPIHKSTTQIHREK